ncbi:hypothetical protein O3M35_006105 [Rhynocoris fuscipes]
MDVPQSNAMFGMGSGKKHKKHKKEKFEDFRPNSNANGGVAGTPDRGSGLKLILKVGSSSTPEHQPDSPAASGSTLASGAGPPTSTGSTTTTSSNSSGLVGSLVPIPVVNLDDESCHSASSSFHKKSKKKKKKKDRDHDKKRRHHHKKKKYEDQSSQDGVSIGEESMVDSPQVNVAKDPLPAGDDQFIDNIGSPREPRLCVQLSRQKAVRSPLQKLLDYLQVQLEKRDPQQFFAWPVTDQIAPGYSLTISRPMDFSTMKQKIDDNAYPNLASYISDLKLMCNNAMIYNQPDTIYYKAAKRLLHGGLKLLSPERLKQALPSIPALASVPAEQLGFSVGNAVSIENGTGEKGSEEVKDDPDGEEGPKKRPANYMPESKFEAIPDDMTPEQILEQAQKAALASAEKLTFKKIKTNMGFLRQQEDGSTSLAIFIGGDGIDPEKPRFKSVTIGQLVGRLTHGTGQLHGFREDRRNVAKTVKPLNYGAFGSYAPSYDSTFANLSKEESDLLYETYGDENATLYAESVLNFAKDCDYTLTMVDNLLDLLTGGEHRKSKAIIDEQRRFREEEEKVRELMEGRGSNIDEGNNNNNSNLNLTEPSPKKIDGQTGGKIELSQLRTLSELGIDVSFLNDYETLLNEDQSQIRQQSCVQEKLEQTSVLLEKLQQVQNDRLSAPPPPHLSHILQPSDTELNLAEKITESLTELAKQVPPAAIVAVPAIRKAMGVASESPVSVSTATNTSSPIQTSVTGGVVALDGDSSGADGSCPVGQLDLESELRELLESDTALSNFPLHDDKTIEEMLSGP